MGCQEGYQIERYVGLTKSTYILKESTDVNFCFDIFVLGPMMGHCVATVDPWTILVVGGFSPETADYIDKAYFLNTKTNEWYTKPWSKLKYGKVHF